VERLSHSYWSFSVVLPLDGAYAVKVSKALSVLGSDHSPDRQGMHSFPKSAKYILLAIVHLMEPKEQAKVVKSEEEWRRELTTERFRILRKDGTEPAFLNKYWDNKKKGEYRCAGCGNPLFSSDAKFESGSGWPSFWQPVSESSVLTERDDRFGTRRTAVKCARCGGHLGHVFDDGPPPTGLRYCMNSGAMDFVEEKKSQ
jgi:peptide-methionine (R)-S-oxide reductase